MCHLPQEFDPNTACKCHPRGPEVRNAVRCRRRMRMHDQIRHIIVCCKSLLKTRLRLTVTLSIKSDSGQF